MTKISNKDSYKDDIDINGKDSLLGTDSDKANKQTANFQVEDLSGHFNMVNGVRNFDYNFYNHVTLSPTPKNGYFYSNDNEIDPNNITHFIFSKLTNKKKDVTEFIDSISVTNPFDVIISQKQDVNNNSVFFFRITDVEVFSNYYKLNVSEVFFPENKVLQHILSYAVFNLKSEGESIHNNLQGLNDGDYIHLTQAEKERLDNLPEESVTNHSELILDDGTNPHGTTKSDVGLGNVDNTSDLAKPVSTETQNALNTKQNTSEKAQPNGYASLDGGGKIPSSQLPSYVDDIIEVADFASLPITGETGKIYITLDDNKEYRWSGSDYIQITNGFIASSDDVPEGMVNLYATNLNIATIINNSTTTAPDSSQFVPAIDTFGTLIKMKWVDIFTFLVTATTIGNFIFGLTNKPTPIDADVIGFSDTADSNKEKNVTFLQAWTNYFKIKADLVYQAILTDVNFGAFINLRTSKTTPVDADQIGLMDSADSNKQKKLSWLNLKNTVYAGLQVASETLTGIVSIGTQTFGGNKTIVGESSTVGNAFEVQNLAHTKLFELLNNGNKIMTLVNGFSTTNGLIFKNTTNGFIGCVVSVNSDQIQFYNTSQIVLNSPIVSVPNSSVLRLASIGQNGSGIISMKIGATFTSTHGTVTFGTALANNIGTATISGFANKFWCPIMFTTESIEPSDVTLNGLIGSYFKQSMKAQANNAVLIGVQITPNYNDNGFTGHTKIAFSIDSTVGFGLYQKGSSIINYFEGIIAIGTTTPTAGYKLHVNGTTKADGVINLKGYTVGTLPSGTLGDTAYVTDAVTPTYLGVLTGGGAVKCPVFYNGTAWVSN